MNIAQRMYLGYMRTRPQRTTEQVIADFVKTREEHEAQRVVEDPTVREAVEMPSVWRKNFLLSRDWHGQQLECGIDYSIEPILVYVSENFTASVHLTGPIGGWVTTPDQPLSCFLPDTPGDYYLSADGLHEVGFWPDRGGRLRRLLCALRLHGVVRIGGYPFKVSQCRHCLRVRVGFIYGNMDPAVDSRGYIRELASAHSGKLPLPKGPQVRIPLV